MITSCSSHAEEQVVVRELCAELLTPVPVWLWGARRASGGRASGGRASRGLPPARPGPAATSAQSKHYGCHGKTQKRTSLSASVPLCLCVSLPLSVSVSLSLCISLPSEREKQPRGQGCGSACHTRRSPSRQERSHSLLAVRTSHLVSSSRALVKLILQMKLSNSLRSPGLHVAPDATDRLPQAAGTLPEPVHKVSPGDMNHSLKGLPPPTARCLSHGRTQHSS